MEKKFEKEMKPIKPLNMTDKIGIPKLPKIELNVDFDPIMNIFMNGKKLGSVSFSSFNGMTRFMGRLHEVVGDLIKEFAESKKREE